MLLAAEDPTRVEYACPAADVDKFGLTCSEDEPCDVFLELASAEGVGSTIFAAGNLHTVTTTLYGVLLMSGDGGKTWTEPNPRIEGAALDQVQFPDFQHGWASGVTVEPLARDPFFLVTADGGKPGAGGRYSTETHYGSIQQFWFDSAKSGQLILERSQGSASVYEIYETSNGGDTWTIKEAGNKNPKLAKAPAKDSATWRVRTDAASKTNRIERRNARGGLGRGGELRRARRSLQMSKGHRAGTVPAPAGFDRRGDGRGAAQDVLFGQHQGTPRLFLRRLRCARRGRRHGRSHAGASGRHAAFRARRHGRVRSCERAMSRWSTIPFAAGRICPTSPRSRRFLLAGAGRRFIWPIARIMRMWAG